MKKQYQKLLAHLDATVMKRSNWLTRMLWPSSIVIFGLTILYWSFMGSAVHMGNADQLVDPQLFDSPSTFHGAIFPGAHTFLLKWPLFWAIALLRHSSFAFFLSGFLLTGAVGALIVWLVMRIEHRPAIRGLLILAAASILLAVPTQPYSGALLPVNMSMITTRNLEYVCFVLALWWALSRRSRWQWPVSLVVLTLLFASDKLFVGLAIAAGVFAMGIAALWRYKQLLRTAAKWLVIAISAFVLATVLLKGMSASGFVTVADGGKVSPYAIETQPLAITKGTAYAVLGTLTNFGAQPINDITAIGKGTSAIFHEVVQPSLLAHTVNFFLFATAAAAAWRLLRKKPAKLDRQTELLVYTVGAALGAVGLFILTKHYYVVDARYLTIVFFALFIALCTAVSRRDISQRVRVVAFIALLFSIAAGVITTGHTTFASLSAGQQFHDRNVAVARAMKDHHINTLVGDYWRVVPIKNLVTHTTIIPLSSCSEVRTILATHQRDVLDNSPYAVLASEDKGQTDFPPCSLQTMTHAWGAPAEVVRVTSKENLLIYR